MRIPIYQIVSSQIKALIDEGEYKPNDFLPPEGELQQHYSVSRSTIRKAVELLVKEGYLEVKQGRGTRVLDGNNTQKLIGVTSISDTLRNKGYQVTTRDIYINAVPASPKIAKLLQVPERSDVFRIQRVTLADGTPIAIMENYISADLAPDLDRKADEITALYNYLEQEYHIVLDRAQDILSSRNADLTEAQILETKPGSALIILKRQTYYQNHPITYDIVTLRADKYQFEVETMGKQYGQPSQIL